MLRYFLHIVPHTMLDYIRCIYSSYGHFCLTYFCKQHPQGQVSLCFGHCKELMILTYFHELKNTGHLFRFQNNITPVNIMSILISCRENVVTFELPLINLERRHMQRSHV